MANHRPSRSRFRHRHATTLIVYIRDDDSAILNRHSIQGLTQEQHMKYYNVGPVTAVERIIGRLERSVEWHGRIGYGKLV